MMEDLILIGIIAIILLLIVLIFYRMHLKQQISLAEIKSKSLYSNDSLQLIVDLQKEFKSFQNELVNNFKNDLNHLNQSTLTNLHNVSLSINEGLNLNLEKTNKSFLEMSKQLVSVEKTQESLNELSNDITALQNVLIDKKSRGIFGEIELYSILKTAYGLNDKLYQKQYKLSNGNIVDAVIFAPEPLNKIVVDSKFPLENYLKTIDDTLNTREVNEAKRRFISDMKRHIDDIKNKYIILNETSDLAFLFIPSEAIFSEINGKYLEIVEYSYRANVYLVSPTTLMAYISAIKTIYLGIKQNEKVDLIKQEFAKLAVEFERFEKRYEIITNSFNRLSSEMKNVSISANKIIKRFYEIQAVQIDEEDNNDQYV